MAEEEERQRPCPANDNGSSSGEPLDPRIGRIAEAIGRQLARAQGKPPAAAKTMNPDDDSNVESGFPKMGLAFSEPVTFSTRVAHSHR
jgi:hypothetical protein